MPKLRLETDLGSSLKAFGDLDKALNRTKTGLTTAAAEAKKLEQAASRIVQQNLTPQERYNVALDKMARAVKAGKLTMDEAERTAARLRQRLDETTRSSDGVFGAGALANIKSYLTGVVGISSAVALFRSEMEAIRAEAEKTAQTQLTAAQSRDVLKRNISTLGIPAARQIEQRADALAAELGLPQRFVDQGLAAAFGSSEGNAELAFSRVRAAGRFLKTRPEGLGEFAGALGDISKATGDPDAMRNLGFLLAVGAESRVTDDRKLAETVPVALAGAKAFGARAEESGALFDALSKAGADTEGRLTGTGVIRTAEQLSEFFDKRIKEGKTGADIDTFAERLQALRSDPTLAREFADTASFEAKVKGPLREFLLDPNAPISKEYQRLLRGFGTRESQIGLARETVGYLDEGRIASTAAIERTIESRMESFRLGKDADLTTASRDEIIRRYAQLGGIPESLARFYVTLQSGFTMSPEEAIQQLEYAPQERIGSKPDAELAENTRQMIQELRQIRQKQQPVQAPAPSGRAE